MCWTSWDTESHRMSNSEGSRSAFAWAISTFSQACAMDCGLALCCVLLGKACCWWALKGLCIAPFRRKAGYSLHRLCVCSSMVWPLNRVLFFGRGECWCGVVWPGIPQPRPACLPRSQSNLSQLATRTTATTVPASTPDSLSAYTPPACMGLVRDSVTARPTPRVPLPLLTASHTSNVYLAQRSESSSQLRPA